VIQQALAAYFHSLDHYVQFLLLCRIAQYYLRVTNFNLQRDEWSTVNVIQMRRFWGFETLFLLLLLYCICFRLHTHKSTEI